MFGIKSLTTRDTIARVKKNQIEFMIRRGYQIDEEDHQILKMDTDELIDYFVETGSRRNLNFFLAMNKIYEKIVDENGDPAEEGTTVRNLVYYIPVGNESSICVEKINPIIDLAMRIDVRDIDIIAHANLYSHSITALNLIKNRSFLPWTHMELMMNPFDSYLVPDYHVMTRKEIRETFYNSEGKALVRRSKMPKMRRDGAIAKFLRLKPGAVLSYVYRQPYVPVMVPESLEYVVVTRDLISEMMKVATSGEIDDI